MLQICHCGVQAGYVHVAECPYPLFTENASDVARWQIAFDVNVRATRAGRDHGQAAASWYFDGNTELETYELVLRGLEDGDPAITDSLPYSPLSGEYAGDPTPQSVLEDVGFEGTPDEGDDVLRLYEDAFSIASYDAIESACRKALEPGDAAGFDLEPAYRHSQFPGVAWRADRILGSQIVAHMIGDDRSFRLEPADLEPIGDNDYCDVCGQIGCAHGSKGMV